MIKQFETGVSFVFAAAFNGNSSESSNSSINKSSYSFQSISHKNDSIHATDQRSNRPLSHICPKFVCAIFTKYETVNDLFKIVMHKPSSTHHHVWNKLNSKQSSRQMMVEQQYSLFPPLFLAIQIIVRHPDNNKSWTKVETNRKSILSVFHRFRFPISSEKNKNKIYIQIFERMSSCTKLNPTSKFFFAKTRPNNCFYQWFTTNSGE